MRGGTARGRARAAETGLGAEAGAGSAASFAGAELPPACCDARGGRWSSGGLRENT